MIWSQHTFLAGRDGHKERAMARRRRPIERVQVYTEVNAQRTGGRDGDRRLRDRRRIAERIERATSGQREQHSYARW
jgi:hypothetical protein